jgi:hypothetical protein
MLGARYRSSVRSSSKTFDPERVRKVPCPPAEQADGPGSFDVYASSPVTGKSYTDTCSYNPSTGIVSCSHGSDLIEFAYGDVADPVTIPLPANSSPTSGSCGDGIDVNSATSCPFAQNVVEQYTQQAEQADGPGSFDVSAYSPVTGKSYTDSCAYSPCTEMVSCSHGSDLIEFAYGSR